MNPEDPVRPYRLIKATAIVMAVLLMAPGAQMIGHLFGVSRAHQALAQGADGLDASAIVQAPGAFEALERLEAQAEACTVGLPETFSREIGTLPDARDLRANAEGTVVGYLVDGSEDDALERVIADLEGKGWTSVPLGGVCGATFVKDSGACTWAVATCAEVGDSTSVVIRTVMP